MTTKTIKILIVCAIFSGFNALAGENKEAKKIFEVTITNLTKGQPITPPVVVVHSPQYKLVELGGVASRGLAHLAQDGVTDTFKSELSENKRVIRTAVGSGVVLPGESTVIRIEANDSRYKISTTAMLARTNDAILISRSYPLRLKKGQSYTSLAQIYDAGVEDNTELCAHIPAPPCGNAMVSAGNGEGFVHLHPGLQNIGDLEPLRDAFASKVAKITIKRIR